MGLRKLEFWEAIREIRRIYEICQFLDQTSHRSIERMSSTK